MVHLAALLHVIYLCAYLSKNIMNCKLTISQICSSIEAAAGYHLSENKSHWKQKSEFLLQHDEGSRDQRMFQVNVSRITVDLKHF